jgi:hypothetical protein
MVSFDADAMNITRLPARVFSIIEAVAFCKILEAALIEFGVPSLTNLMGTPRHR